MNLRPSKPAPIDALPHAERVLHWLKAWGAKPALGDEFTRNALRAMIEDAVIADRVANLRSQKFGTDEQDDYFRTNEPTPPTT